MNGISSSVKPSGPIAASMNGRRRPSGVWNVSLHGPMTGESAIAKTPSAPRTRPITVPESVKRESSGGRYAAVGVIENASPKPPRPSRQKSDRLRGRGAGRSSSAVAPATVLGGRDRSVGGEASAHDLHDRPL